jgi:glutamyl-tRNA reductase
MMLYLLGLSHKSAPVEVRERLTFSAAELPAALLALKAQMNLRESFLLSTCNRTEFYVRALDFSQACQSLSSFLSSFKNLEFREVKPYLYCYEQQEACRHLFKVAAGLDSMVIGEGEILGQIKSAYALAQRTGNLDKILSKLCLSAISCGKKVRSETRLRYGITSISGAAVELAKSACGSLNSCKVLLLGSGKIGSKAAALFKEQKVKQLFLLNRDQEKARLLAEKLQVKTAPLEELRNLLKDADLVLSCTSAPHFILTKAGLALVCKERSKPLILIDLALPRDIEPSAGKLSSVTLYDMDDIDRFLKQQDAIRLKELEPAQEIVEAEFEKYLRWYYAHKNSAVIRALKDKFEAYHKFMLQKLAQSLPHLSEDEHKSLEKISKSLTNKILHTYLMKLKEPDFKADESFSRHLTEVFNLAED